MVFEAGQKSAVIAAVDNAFEIEAADFFPVFVPVFGNDRVRIGKGCASQPRGLVDLPAVPPIIVAAVGFADVHFGKNQPFGTVFLELQAVDIFS